MNVEEEKDMGNGKKLFTFGRTPLMSTYLVAFAIGDFENVEVRKNFLFYLFLWYLDEWMCCSCLHLTWQKRQSQLCAWSMCEIAWLLFKLVWNQNAVAQVWLLSVPEFSMGLGFSIIKFFDIFRSKRKLGSDYAREAFVFYDPKLKRIKLVEKKWLVENVLGRMSLSSIYSRGDLTHQKDSTFSTKRTRFFL